MDSERVSSIGRNLARYRKLAGLSAQQLADLTGEGLTRAVIANLESGRKDDVTVRQLMALAHALRVPPALLVADAFDPSAPSAYPLPEVEVVTIEPTSGIRIPGLALNRQYELLEWLTARSMRTTDLTGAVGAAHQALTVLQGYADARRRLDRAIRAFYIFHWGDFTFEGPPELAPTVEGVAEQVKSGADEVTRWIAQAQSIGIQMPNAAEDLQRTMDAINFDDPLAD